MADPNPDARVTVEQVRDIISTSLTDGQVNAMINTAHLAVEENLLNRNLSEDRLEQIELWLSAHYIAIRDPRKESVKVDEVTVKYQGRVGLGLEATMYGQQAIALDPSNTLASASLKRAVIRAE